MRAADEDMRPGFPLLSGPHKARPAHEGHELGMFLWKAGEQGTEGGGYRAFDAVSFIQHVRQGSINSVQVGGEGRGAEAEVGIGKTELPVVIVFTAGDDARFRFGSRRGKRDGESDRGNRLRKKSGAEWRARNAGRRLRSSILLMDGIHGFLSEAGHRGGTR